VSLLSPLLSVQRLLRGQPRSRLRRDRRPHRWRRLSISRPHRTSWRKPASVATAIRARAGNLSLQTFDIHTAADHADVTEKMIRKLRAGHDAAGRQRRVPSDSVLTASQRARSAGDAKADAPSPGRRTFQRLNRAEYSQSVHDLLALDVNAGDYLPLDTEERELRQHRRRAAAVADADAVVSDGGGRVEPARGGRSRPRRRAK
jgi:hypothetical protein